MPENNSAATSRPDVAAMNRRLPSIGHATRAIPTRVEQLALVRIEEVNREFGRNGEII